MKKESLNISLQKLNAPNDNPYSALASMYSDSLLFKGDEGNPFLAPRGICLTGERLMVSDTGQNRIFIWNNMPGSTFCIPDVVLGQTLKDDKGRNASTKVSASTLQYPSGIWSDGKKLVVADAWNHRVLIWFSIPSSDGCPADVVIGQPGFNHNLPNVKGVGQNPKSNTLHWPYGVTSDGQRLFIADTGNRRILIYNEWPTQNFASADQIIGKPNFQTRDYESDDAIWPYSVRLSAHGALAITDTQYYRVLLWEKWEDALKYKADYILGQPDFESNGQNQYKLFPESHTLNWCYDSCFLGKGIMVADTGNSRLLYFKEFPRKNNIGADNLIGKTSFNIGSENTDTVVGTEKTLYWPFSISHNRDKNILGVADTGNHRIQLYTLKNETL